MLVAVRRGLLFVAAVVVVGAAGASAAPASRAAQRSVASVTAGSLLVTGGLGGRAQIQHAAGRPALSGSVLVQGGPSKGVYAVDAAGGPLKQLVPGPTSTAAWSPDGKRLAFVSTTPQPAVAVKTPGVLKVVGADGAGLHRLVELEDADLIEIAWSPDSRRLAYSTRDGTIRVVGADGGGDRLLTRGDRGFAWSPDGTKLAFTREDTGTNNVSLYSVVTRPPGPGQHAHVQRLTHGPDVFSTPSWSADGRRIAFYPCCLHGFDVVSLKTGTVRSFGTGVEVPVFSPDGRSIALLSASSTPSITLVRADGSGARQVGDFGAGKGAAEVAWSPDSRALAVETCCTGVLEVWSVTADGSGQHLLTEGGRLGYSDVLHGWQPAARSIASLAGQIVPADVPTDSVADGTTLRTTHSITRIAAAGTAVAVQYPLDFQEANGQIPRSCSEVWNAVTGQITRFLGGVGCAPASRDHSHVAFDGDRLLWVLGPHHEAGIDSWEAETATLEHPAPRYIYNPRYGYPISDPVAEAGLFVFEIWKAPCGSLTHGCNPPPPPKRIGQLFRIDPTQEPFGASMTPIASSDGAITPLAVDNRRILVSHENGSFEIDNADGTHLVSFTVGPPLVAADDADPSLQACLQGNDVVVAGGGYLAHYDATTGAQLGPPVPRAGTLAGCANGIVATAGPTTVTLTRLTDGATATIYTGGTPSPDPATAGAMLPVPARLDTAGLFYAWTVDDTAYPGRVTFIPTAKLPLH